MKMVLATKPKYDMKKLYNFLKVKLCYRTYWKQSLALIFMFLLVFVSGYAQLTYVPDDTFEQKLIDLGYDDVLDDYVLTSNINTIENLNLDNEVNYQFPGSDVIDNYIPFEINGAIYDLTGIQDFTSLVSLDVGFNRISSLDLSNNLNLTSLDCEFNDILSQLILPSSGPNGSESPLEFIYARVNTISSIDFTNSPNIQTAYLQRNLIPQINLTSNPLLETLVLSRNLLNEINVCNNPLLFMFMIDYNNISELDISNNSLLSYMYGHNTSLSCVRVSDLDNPYLDNPYLYPYFWFDEGVEFSLDCGFENQCQPQPLECDISIPLDLQVCDNDYDGIAFFDLTINESVILGDLSFENYSVLYFESLNDADLNINPIAEPSFYSNVTANVQTIFVRVSSEIDNCISIVSFEIIVEIEPELTDVNSQIICNCDTTSQVVFENNENITYYWATSESANLVGYELSGTGNIPHMTLCNMGTDLEILDYQYYAVNENSGCISMTKVFTIEVAPEVLINPIEDYSYENGVITDEIVFSSAGNGGVFSYSWTNDNPSIGLSVSGQGNIPSFQTINAGCSPVAATIVVTPMYEFNGISCEGAAEVFTITVNNISCNYETISCNGSAEVYNFCYETGVDNTYTYTSIDGTPLNLSITEGQVESGFDELLVRDTDGTVIYSGYGNNGDLSGLSFQSSGDAISLEVVEDGSISCNSTGNINPISVAIICQGLSTDEESKLDIFVYPNPTTSYIYLNNSLEIEAMIFDINGKQVMREYITDKFDISCLEKGTYILNLSDGINISTHKIIKE